MTDSFGVTCYQLGDSLEALLARADAAMYRAKRGERNRVKVDIPALSGALAAETHPLPGGTTDSLPGGPNSTELPAPELTDTNG